MRSESETQAIFLNNVCIIPILKRNNSSCQVFKKGIYSNAEKLGQSCIKTTNRKSNLSKKKVKVDRINQPMEVSFHFNIFMQVFKSSYLGHYVPQD